MYVYMKNTNDSAVPIHKYNSYSVAYGTKNHTCKRKTAQCSELLAAHLLPLPTTFHNQ